MATARVKRSAGAEWPDGAKSQINSTYEQWRKMNKSSAKVGGSNVWVMEKRVDETRCDDITTGGQEISN